MREKILTLMSLTLTPHEHNVGSIVEQLRGQLLQFVGKHEEACPGGLEGAHPDDCVCERKLPEEAAEAVKEVETALLAGKGDLEGQIATLYEGVFTKAEIDEVIEFQLRPIGHKLREVTPKLMEAINMASSAWSGAIVEGLNEKLTQLLGMAPAEIPIEPMPPEMLAEKLGEKAP